MLIIAPIGFFVACWLIWICFGILGLLLKLPGMFIDWCMRGIWRIVSLVWRAMIWIHNKAIWIG